MNKYQQFIAKNIRCYLATEIDFNENKTLLEFLDSNENLVITQDENYNIKTRNIMLMSEAIAYAELDGNIINAVDEKENNRNKHYIIVPLDFDNRAKQLKIYFSHNLADPLTLNIKFIEIDHKIYDSKVQAKINDMIKPEHKTGTNLVNIYWNLVSDEVVATQINLYFISKEERLIGKYIEKGSMFKSITGLAYGTYRYEIIEFNKKGKKIAKTPKLEFELSAPNYSGKPTIVCGW